MNWAVWMVSFGSMKCEGQASLDRNHSSKMSTAQVHIDDGFTCRNGRIQVVNSEFL